MYLAEMFGVQKCNFLVLTSSCMEHTVEGKRPFEIIINGFFIPMAVLLVGEEGLNGWSIFVNLREPISEHDLYGFSHIQQVKKTEREI